MKSDFNLGTLPLYGKYSPKDAQKLGETLASSPAGKTEEGKSLKEAIDVWVEKGDVNNEEFLKNFELVAGGARKDFKAAKNEYWDAFNNKDNAGKKAAKEQMGVSGAFLTETEKLKAAVRESQARLGLEAAVNGLSGPTGEALKSSLLGKSDADLNVFSSYLAWTNPTGTDSEGHKESAIPVLQHLEGLEAGEGHGVSQGNRIHSVQEERVWWSMKKLWAEAAADAKAGKKVEMDLQYYELRNTETLKDIAQVGRNGGTVRLNLDSGRFSYPDKDAKGNYYDGDSILSRARVFKALAKEKNIATTVFKTLDELEDPTDLMHRKVFRVNDKVLLSGMNANQGSGENVDAGVLVKGPAAKALSQNLDRDIKDSMGTTVESLWNESQLKIVDEGRIKIGRGGLEELVHLHKKDITVDDKLPSFKSKEDVLNYSKKHKIDLAQYFETDDFEADLKALFGGYGRLELNRKGRDFLFSAYKDGLKAIDDPKKKELIDNASVSSGRKAGDVRVDLADLPSEREAVLINSIMDAEKFVYMPAFVITRGVAAALVSRRDELKKQGKELDVKVIADPGIYPGGGTPNTWGVHYLENHDVPVRWALLPRTGHHDRKVHAKELITDKGQLVGSMNFSRKGLRENWETSAFFHTDGENDAEHGKAVSHFDSLWENYSVGISSRKMAKSWNRDQKVGQEYLTQDAMTSASGKIIRAIENYEKKTADWMAELQQEPKVQEKYEALVDKGLAEGYAWLKAAEDHLGSERFQGELKKLQNETDIGKFLKYYSNDK